MSTRTSSIVSACALLLALGGCSNETVKKVQGMADRACQCADAACADKVQKDYYDLAKANAKSQGTQEERDEVEQAYNRMNECLVRARSGGGQEGAASPEGAAGAAPADDEAGKEAGK
jgi:hypothetical protein